MSEFDILTYPKSGTTKAIVLDTLETPPRPELILPAESRTGLAAIALEGYFSQVTQTNLLPSEVTLVSDKGMSNELLELGMGGVEIHQPEGVTASVDLLTESTKHTSQALYETFPLYSDLAYEQVAASLYEPDTVKIVGFVGRTGTGKSTTIRRIVTALSDMGGSGSLFKVDAFFKKSRAERKAWLNEEGISEEERAERQNVTKWWDHDAAASALHDLRDGQAVQLKGLYDRSHNGEKVGTMDIVPNPHGHVIFVDGTTLLLPEMRDAIDSFVYVNTHDSVRTKALEERNLANGYTVEESRQSKQLTDEAETEGHLQYSLRNDPRIKSQLIVLDNTHRGDTVKLMPPYIPKK